MENVSTAENSTGLNRLGAITSTVCALHCALCALAPALLSILGLSVLISHAAEWIFTILASILAIAAAIKGYCPCESWKKPMMFVAGILILLIARSTEALGINIPEVYINITGGGILVLGHLSNLRACRK